MSTKVVCDPTSSFFGYMGVMSAVVFANLGAAYGTAKSGVGICSMGVMRPDLIMRSIIPVVMAGVLGIYGLITAVIINEKLTDPKSYSAYQGYVFSRVRNLKVRSENKFKHIRTTSRNQTTASRTSGPD